MIHLIGPGGAGKSTTGRIVAALLDWPFRDLDRLFEKGHGNIDDFIARQGYANYAAANVETYLQLNTDGPGVLAVSSGFMTYPETTHARLSAIRSSLVIQSSTFVLLPSVDLETCVAETLRRQRARELPCPRSDNREEEVIRERFQVYVGLPVQVITTMRPATAVARDIVARMASV